MRSLAGNRFFLAAAVFAITALSTIGALSNGFVYDDAYQITGNWWMRDFSNIGAPFSSNVWGFLDKSQWANYYRPLVHVAYMAVYSVFKAAPFGYHLLSIILGACVSAAVFLTIDALLGCGAETADSRPRRMCAFAGALIFAVHPIHVEAVAFASAVAEPLFVLFGLISVYIYVTAGESILKKALSAVFFLGALLSKETAAAVLPMIILCDSFAGKKMRLKNYVPHAAALGLYLAMRVYGLGGLLPIKTYAAAGDWTERAASAVSLFAEYMRMLVLPAPLSVHHAAIKAEPLFGARFVISAVFAVAYVAAVVFSGRCWRTPLLWGAIALIPVLYVPGSGPIAFTERYLYLPSVGLALFVALAAYAAYGQKLPRVAIAGVVAVIAIAGFAASAKRTSVWKDSFTLWQDATLKYPGEAKPRNEYGIALRDAGHFEEAERELRTAIAIDPFYALPHDNLGKLYNMRGMTKEAAEEFRRAIELDPMRASSYTNMGMVYVREGRFDEAIEEYKKTLSMNPFDAYAYTNLGGAYAAKGMAAEAEAAYLNALKINPELAGAHYNLGVLYDNAGRLNDAEREYLDAVRFEPGNGAAHYNLGNLYGRSNRPQKAKDEFLKAVRIMPNSALVHNGLGAAYREEGLLREAAEEFLTAVRLAPDYAIAHENLGRVYERMGRKDEAKREINEAERLKAKRK